MSGVKPFQWRQKWGWRLVNDAGTIEYSRPAVFDTQDQAVSNAATGTRTAMASLGIIEDTTTPDPEGDLHVDAGADTGGTYA